MTDLTPLFGLQDWVVSAPINNKWSFIAILAVLSATCLISVITSYRRLANGSSTIKWVVPLVNALSFVLLVVLILDINKMNEKESKMILLTHGYLTAQNNSQSESDVIRVAIVSQLNEEEISLLADNTVLLSSPDDLIPFLSSHPNLEILGDGLSEQHWRDLKKLSKNDFSVSWHASSPYEGVVDVAWSKDSFVGQNNTLSARLQMEESDNLLYEVSLVEPSGSTLDKAVVRVGEQFTLSFRPKVEGRWLYSLEVKERSDDSVVIREPVSVNVKRPQRLNVLIKQSAPSFETRHLQNWLGRYGHAVTVLTQISRDKHLVQRINGIKDANSNTDGFLSKGQFTETTLSNADFLIMDGRAFSVMDAEQHGLLKRAVSQGLGVLIIADERLLSYLKEETQNLPGLLSEFTLSRHKDTVEIGQQNAPVLVNWLNHQTQLPIKISPYLLSGRHADTLAYDGEGHSIVMNKNYGQGHVAMSLISESYQWQTSGERKSYSRYWQSMLMQIVGLKNRSYWLPQSNSHLFHGNERYRQCAAMSDGDNQAVGARLASPATDEISIKLAQVGLNESQYCAFFWPQVAGWYVLKLNSQGAPLLDTQQLYVHDKVDWQAEAQRINHLATKHRSERYQKKITIRASQPLGKWPVALLLLCCLTYLWVERKFLQQS